MRIYFSLLLATGLGPSEGVALKWQDFYPMRKTLRVTRSLEYVNGKIYFKEPKNKRSRRTIDLHDVTVSLLLEHKPQDAQADDLIFANLERKPINIQKLSIQCPPT